MRIPGSGRRGKGKVELCMTPMIDIVFNLVIFFLLMPSFEAADGYLPTNLPNTAAPGPPPTAEMQKGVRVDLWYRPTQGAYLEAEVRLNGETLADFAALRHRLRAARRELKPAPGRTDVSVIIAPDKRVWHRDVIAAMDAAIDAGFEDIRFTVPQ